MKLMYEIDEIYSKQKDFAIAWAFREQSSMTGMGKVFNINGKKIEVTIKDLPPINLNEDFVYDDLSTYPYADSYR